MSYEITYTDTFKADYLKHDARTTDRIDRLVANIAETPYCGIGKPEALRYELTGFWARRINRKDRLIYEVGDDAVVLVSCRGHYQLRGAQHAHSSSRAR